MALSRFAGEYTSERTVSVLSLPSDEMKGKIIGREGRNIRTLEALCGVDLIVDDTPEAVVISGFDPVRRELARKTIEKLMEDGRVHPARIEEVVEKMRSELNKTVREEGEKICVELGVTNLHPEIMRVLGSLKYRQSFTQNTLNHCIEVASLAGIMAGEMGSNVKLARRAGLLHDIGKGIDHTVEGNHAIVGAEFCKKFGENEAVCHAIRAHHDDEKPNSTIAFIVQAANILSNSRPGARRPGMENFINRLQDLESIGNSFDGVQKTFAVQAGREVRVLVEASRVTDDQAVMLSRDVARKIEREMPHLGTVKVSVLRETRSVEMAR
jgi:ribonuclease Y